MPNLTKKESIALPLKIRTDKGLFDITEMKKGIKLPAWKKGRVINKVKEIEKIKVKGTFYCINNRVLLYENQSIVRNGNVTHVKFLQIGDHLVGYGGRKIVVRRLVKIKRCHYFYKLIVTGNHTYFLNGILMHNASRFWVGGTGNWDAAGTTHWSATTGGSTGASVPTSVDDVTFDSLSNATGYTVTVTATASMANITWGQPLTGNLTFAGSSTLSIFGSVSIASGVVWTATGSWSLRASSGTKTITTNGVVVGPIASTFQINASGATYQLSDNFNIQVQQLTLTAGSFSANGKDFNIQPTTGTHQVIVTGAWTFYNLNFTLNSPNGKDAFVFQNDITVSNNLSVNGTSSAYRVFMGNATTGSIVNITVSGTATLNNIIFQGITAVGTAWSGTDMGDGGSNTNITFDAPATQYWYTTTTGTKNWSDSANWFLGTGGTGGAGRVPLPQDDVKIDANSIGAASTIINADPMNLGKSIDFTGVTNSPAFKPVGLNIIYGSLTLAAAMTVTANSATIEFDGTSSYTLTTNAVVINNSIEVFMNGGTITLQDDLNVVNITVSLGSFNTNNKNVTCFGLFSNGSKSRSVILGSSLFTITNSTTVWQTTGSNLTMNAGTSTIKFTDSTSANAGFNGGGFTFYNLWFARGASTGMITISGSNTFNDFKDTGTVAHTIFFAAGTTTTVTTFTVSGTAGNVISINSTSSATYALVKAGGGIVSCDYLNIRHSVAGPGAWYAGTHSTNNQGLSTAGSGWQFSAPPLPGNIIQAPKRQAPNRSYIY